jgi:excisionase family DNA binding protein
MKIDRQPPSLKLYVVDEVAEILDMSGRTVRRKIEKGEIKACRFGRLVRVHPADLADYINRHRGR